MGDRLTFLPRPEASTGMSAVLTPDTAPLSRLAVSRLRMDAALPRVEGTTEDREVALHILIGSCRVEAKGPWGSMIFENLGERRDVFSGLPTTLVLAPDTRYVVEVVGSTADLVVAEAALPQGESRAAALLRPQDVRVHQIGEGHYRRVVREVLGGEGRSQVLRVGETVNPVGCWSSWPHHEFAADATLAPRFEEVFLYFTKPKSGWAIQVRDGLFSDGSKVSDSIVVRNGDAAIMPLGDHPVVAGVDSQLLYVWCYLSPIPKRYAKWAEDIGGYA